MTIRVLIADDQAMVRAGFAALLGASDGIEVVGEATDGLQAVELAADLLPDVVLMDVRMPGLDGIEATRRIVESSDPKAGAGRPRVLMLTTFDIDDYIFEAMRAGASGFLLKDAMPDELAAAVRVVARGDALLDPAVTRRMIENFVLTTSAPRQPISLDELTPREREVLTLIAKGLSNQQIARQMVLAEQTVKSHVSRVFMKLGVRDRAQAVIAAYESGLVQPGRDSVGPSDRPLSE